MRMCGKDQCWENGKTLTVSFILEPAGHDPLDPNPDADWTDAIKKCAATWEPFANIKFRFVQVANADVRITLVELPKTSFSLAGNGRYLYPNNSPTMWLQKSLVGKERDSVIMHEFGHVLGAGHEHQNPNAAFDWDKDSVLVDYIIRKRNIENEYGDDLVDGNVTSVELPSLSQMTPYDPLSIMHYPIPPKYNMDKETADIPRNYVLSKWDKAWIARYYPHPQHKIGTVDFTGTTTPKDRRVIPGPQPIPEAQGGPRLTYGLVSLDVTPKSNGKFRVDNLRAEGEGLSSARLDFLETALDDPIFQVGTFHAKPNKTISNITNPPPDQYEHKKPRKFTRPFFEHDPVVIVWISSINASDTEKTQIKAYTSDITSTGFNLCIKSFSMSKIKSADISWVAYPKDTPGIQTGEIEMSSEVTSNAVQFTDSNFTREAKVLVAVNQIYFPSKERIRFKVAANNITADGMTLEVGRNVGATYLAIAKINSVR